MPRANSSVPRHKWHRKIVKLAKGYYGAESQILDLQKMQLKKGGNIHIEIEDRKKELFEVCG